MKTQFKNIALVLTSTLGLSACGVTSVGDAFSGGSSMRIDVEVYKGPLSKNVEIQWGELTAIIRESQTTLATFDDDVLRLASTQGFLKDGELPITGLDIWGDAKSINFKKIKKNLTQADNSVRDVNRLLNGDHKDLKAIKKDIQKARDTLNSGLYFAGQVEKNVTADGEHLTTALAELKSAFVKLAKTLAPLPEGLRAINLGQVPPKTAERLNSEQLKSAISKLSASAVALDDVVKEANKAVDLNVKDLGERLTSKLTRDRYGPISITPHNRRVANDRKSTPSRAVARVRGGEISSAKNQLFWCNQESYRKQLDGDYESTANALAAQDCLRLAEIHDEIDHLHRIILPFKKQVQIKNNAKRSIQTGTQFARSLKDLGTGGDPVPLSDLLTWASEIGTRMKHKAFYWAEAMMVAAPDRPVRTMVSAFANMSAELGNQITSRADTILKQCPFDVIKNKHICDNKIAKRMPLSVYLREINPTEFHNLFIYNRSGGLATVEETFSRPAWNLGTEESSDRARIVEKLFADHNWSNINTVYASGQGDVSMAFIKDSIGNWNLKNFKNDPTELLEGYKKITVAAASAAVKLIENAAAPGVPSALSMASNMMRGRVGPGGQNASGIDVDRLAKAVEQQIEGIVKDGMSEEEKIIEDAKTKIDSIKGDKDTIATATKEEEDKRDGLIDKNKQATHKQLLDLLSYHDKTLESLQSAVAASAGASLDELPK